MKLIYLEADESACLLSIDNLQAAHLHKHPYPYPTVLGSKPEYVLVIHLKTGIWFELKSTDYATLKESLDILSHAYKEWMRGSDSLSFNEKA